MGGGHQPHVHRDRPPAADARDLALLERPQEPHLEGGLHVADLVEEEGAAVGQLELARPGLDPGRHPALDAEELALEQRLGERRAVDGDQRPLAPREVVEELRHQLLAGAALAAHQDADAARRHPLDDVQHAAHRRRQGDDPAPGDLLGEPPLEGLVLLLQPLALGLQALHLAGGVEGGAGEGGHRVEEAAVVDGEGGIGVPPDLLVEHGDVAQEDAAVGEGRGEELLVGAPGQLAAGADEGVPLGQQLAPDRGGEQRVPGRQLVQPADAWRPRARRRRRRG